jgi:hypothetical protein
MLKYNIILLYDNAPKNTRDFPINIVLSPFALFNIFSNGYYYIVYKFQMSKILQTLFFVVCVNDLIGTVKIK